MRQLVKLPGPGSPEEGPEPYYVAYIFVFLVIICQLYKLTVSDQAKITLQLRVNFLISCKDF